MSEPLQLPVLSLKGGTGKTTVCLGLASALRTLGKKVGLLDVDIHASSLPRALHLEKEPGYDTLLGGKLRPVYHDGFQLFSIGLLFKEDVPNMWDGELKRDAVRQIARTSVAWDEDLEWLVVDTPPTSGDEIQYLIGVPASATSDGKEIPPSLQNIYGAVIVCQPNDLSVLGIVKTLNMLRQTKTPICGIVANMAGYRCPNCGHVSNPFDLPPEDVRKLAQSFGVRFLGSIPFAEPDERQQAILDITEIILRVRPIILKKDEGGVSRWLLGKGLKLRSL